MVTLILLQKVSLGGGFNPFEQISVKLDNFLQKIKVKLTTYIETAT